MWSQARTAGPSQVKSTGLDPDRSGPDSARLCRASLSLSFLNYKVGASQPPPRRPVSIMEADVYREPGTHRAGHGTQSTHPTAENVLKERPRGCCLLGHHVPTCSPRAGAPLRFTPQAPQTVSRLAPIPTRPQIRKFSVTASPPPRPLNITLPSSRRHSKFPKGSETGHCPRPHSPPRWACCLKVSFPKQATGKLMSSTRMPAAKVAKP